jgi:NAD(P)-dependent dehydrogenase (short-subunit alcohol dehydrogenase family)
MADALRFDGRVVAITGAGGGLGRAYALEIAARGGAIVVNDLGGSLAGGGASTTAADAVVAEIVAAGGKAVASHDDVASPEGAQNIVRAATETFGRLDAVIANAGNMRSGEFETLTADDLASLLAVHVGGSFNMAQAAWPVMKAQGGGRIVFTASSSGIFGIPKLAAYGAAKGGVMGLMHVLSEEGALHGILCNAVMPNAASRMAAGSDGLLDGADWAKPLFPAFYPPFTAGLVAYLAHESCTSTHAIYSALGGRIARVFLGATKGWVGPTDAPPSAEDVAAHFDMIRDDRLGYRIPANALDEFRIVARDRT